MIHIDGVCKAFRLHGRVKVVAHDMRAVFPTGAAVGLLGRNGAGKSTLLQMISGTMNPDRGAIRSTGTISWPVGFAGSFHPDLTGQQNVRFVARVYGIDTDQLIAFVRDFAELGDHFYLPFGTYSSGMRSRLAFGLSMGIRFDTYLVDEVTSVGDASFKAKSGRVFKDRMRTSGAVVVSHSMGMLKRMCDAGAVLEGGRLHYYDRVDDAVEHYEGLVLTAEEREEERAEARAEAGLRRGAREGAVTPA